MIRNLNLLVLLIAASSRAADLSQSTIVLPTNATPAERRGADELHNYAKQMTGADLPVIADDQPLPAHAILLGGGNRHLAALDVKLDPAKLGNEGFVLRTTPEHLIIAGTGKRGTLYGCTTFLEKLGVRWFTPTITRVPREKSMSILTLDETDVPDFEYREPYYVEAEGKDWAARLKINGEHAALDDSTGGRIIYGHFVHTFDRLVPPELFAAHPEYFPLIKGKRTSGYVQRCLTNPDVLKITIDKVEKWIKRAPDATIFSVSQNDCYKFCECDNCKAMEAKFGGQHSGLYLWFANQVAEAIEKDHPDKLIDTLAYQFTEAPPTGIKPRKNVRVRLCPIAVCDAHPHEQCKEQATIDFVDRLKKWGPISDDNLYIWHYGTNFNHFLAPFPDFRQLPDSIRLYKRNGVKGIFVEGSYSSPGGYEAELHSYVIAKLLWDSTADADAMITEWMKGVYGEQASAPMRRWFDLLHDHAVNAPDRHLQCFGNTPFKYFSADFFAESNKLFDQAEKLAAGNDVAEKQIAKARMWLRYAEISKAHKKGPELDKFIADMKSMGIGAVREHGDIASWAAEFK